MIEKIDPHERDILAQVQAEYARALVRLEMVTQLLAAHWQIKEGDNVAPDGTITRQVPPEPVP